MKVLLIVDPQNCFCPGGELPVADGDSIMNGINRLAREGRFDLVVASKDWHPAGHVSFASSHKNAKPFDQISLGEIRQILWPEHAIQGSFGAQFHATLDTSLIHHVILKGTDQRVDSYSAFFDNARIAETGLREVLERAASACAETLGDIELTVCGLALDYCVKFSALDAASLGIQTTVAIDLTRAVEQSRQSLIRLKEEFRSNGITISDSRDVLMQTKQQDQLVEPRKGNYRRPELSP